MSITRKFIPGYFWEKGMPAAKERVFRPYIKASSYGYIYNSLTTRFILLLHGRNPDCPGGKS